MLIWDKEQLGVQVTVGEISLWKLKFNSKTAVTLKAVKDRKFPTDTVWKSLFEVLEWASAQDLGICEVNPRSYLSVTSREKRHSWASTINLCVATAVEVTCLEAELHEFKQIYKFKLSWEISKRLNNTYFLPNRHFYKFPPCLQNWFFYIKEIVL